MCSLAVNDRRQAAGCNFSRNTMQSNKVCQQRTTTVPKNRGTKKYRVGDGTGTVEKWYRGAAVVPWYHATLLSVIRIHLLNCLRTSYYFGIPDMV